MEGAHGPSTPLQRPRAPLGARTLSKKLIECAKKGMESRFSESPLFEKKSAICRPEVSTSGTIFSSLLPLSKEEVEEIRARTERPQTAVFLGEFYE